MVCQARTGRDESDGSSVCISEQRRPEAELAVAADKVWVMADAAADSRCASCKPISWPSGDRMLRTLCSKKKKKKRKGNAPPVNFAPLASSCWMVRLRSPKCVCSTGSHWLSDCSVYRCLLVSCFMWKSFRGGPALLFYLISKVTRPSLSGSWRTSNLFLTPADLSDKLPLYLLRSRRKQQQQTFSH